MPTYKNKKNDVIVLLSGGIDSTACVHYYLRNNFSTKALFIEYGQIVANKEYASAQRIAEYYKINIDIMKADMSERFGQAEIRGRNAFFALSCLVKYPNFSGIISLGIHAGIPFYDTTEVFVNDMNRLFAQYTDGTVRLDAPFLSWEKPMIYQYCKGNSVPTHLTYSCENGETEPCGICSSCLDRKAFECLLEKPN